MKATDEGPAPARILAEGISLAACLLLVRLQLINFLSFHSVRTAATIPTRAGLAGYHDLVYVAALAIAFLTLILIARRSAAIRRLLHVAFLAIAVFSVLLAMANVRIVFVLGSPLTYQWLEYSDFLRSQDARNAILDALTWKSLLLAAAMVVLFFLLARVAMRGLELAHRRLDLRVLAAAASALLLAYLWLGGAHVKRTSWDRYKLMNPVVVFVRSFITAHRSPSLLSMRTRVGPEDFEPSPATRQRASPPPSGGDPTRNILVVVLESVGAEYLQPYGSIYAATPTLEALRPHAAIFENAYAQAASTTSSLVSLLLSVYPSMVQRDFIRDHPALNFPSLSSELKRLGYRTAYFSSADDRFSNMEAFLLHRGFDVVRDYRAFPCDRAILIGSDPNWPFLDGTDDECTADALRRWIDEAPQRPFFAIFWTMMTHYPYFRGQSRIDFGVQDSYLDRYLNALRHDDLVIANLVRFLRERGLERSTLLIVVGDHGEAFGRHGHYAHGTDVYEENVHVPLLLIQPGRFHGERYPQPGGIVDIAPTILDLLGVGPPGLWQGRSLWSAARTGRAYFAAWFSDFQLGYREGDRKFIYDVAEDRFELYDLRSDPHETLNRAAAEPAAVAAAKEKLATWVQYQNRMMQRLFAQESKRKAAAAQSPRP
jgi:lipoteichoic acid synthase